MQVWSPGAPSRVAEELLRMRTFEISTTIHSPPAPIWDTLVDFDHFHEWNSVVPTGRGCAIPGTRLHLAVKQPRGDIQPLRPIVIAVHPNTHLILAATVLHPALVHMEHHLILQPLQLNATQLIQRWICSGLLVPILWARLVGEMRVFAQFGEDLKRHVEQGRAGES
jgi:hypothetical protein